MLRLGSERFKLFQRIGFSAGGEKNGTDCEARIIAKWIGIFDCDNLLIDIARLIFPIEIFEAARFKIAGGERERG